ncbi:MAG: ribonuclease III domain-containing protein [Tissierellia bacterium]|nr:ribonuclease III domain-containing protein [Tissierellia bacterium]
MAEKLNLFHRPDWTEREAAMKNPQVLAFVGDGVFELFARNLILREGGKVGDYHRRASQIVCAPHQALWADALGDFWTEEEAGVYRRGRNTHQKTKAKNATAGDYQKATGLECVLGYLYLAGQDQRLKAVLDEMERMWLSES